MSNRDSDEEGGFERRDLLKGFGLGALGVTSASAMTDDVAAKDGTTNIAEQAGPQDGGMINFATFTPPGEDVEDDSIDTFTDGRLGESWGDLVFSLKLGIERSVPLGCQITIVDKSDNNVVPGTFEEGSSRAFSGIVKSDSGGFALKRERISVRGLGPTNPIKPPNRYWAVLTVVDYSGLSVKESESQCLMDCASVPFTVRHWMQDS